MNLTGSMFIIFICATEIDKVLEVIANVMAIDDDFMGATVKAFTGNLSSLFANTAVAAHGYPKMAFASAIGGSFFSKDHVFVGLHFNIYRSLSYSCNRKHCNIRKESRRSRRYAS